MTKEKRNFKDYFITPFIGGVFALTIICFLIKIDSFSKGLIIVLGGSLFLSILFGSLLILTNKYVRPRIQKYFLNHKNIKSITEKGLEYNDLMKGYFGTYRDYDVQVLCHFDKLDLLTTEYVINIVFEKIDIEKVKQIQKKELFDNTKIAEFFIQKVLRFKLFPPSKEQLTLSIDELIDFLEKKNLKPIRLEKLEKEFKNNVA